MTAALIAVWCVLLAVVFCAGWVACVAFHRRVWEQAAQWGDDDRGDWHDWIADNSRRTTR